MANPEESTSVSAASGLWAPRRQVYGLRGIVNSEPNYQPSSITAENTAYYSPDNSLALRLDLTPPYHGTICSSSHRTPVMSPDVNARVASQIEVAAPSAALRGAFGPPMSVRE